LTVGTTIAVIVGLFLFTSDAYSQQHAQTVPADLDQLVQNAATILRGEVISATIEPHPKFSNIQTVVVTISVKRVLKGEAPATYTFRVQTAAITFSYVGPITGIAGGDVKSIQDFGAH
jgi:hypothetical protein